MNTYEATVSSLAEISSDFLKSAQQQIQQDLKVALDSFSMPESLRQAVYHAVMLGGKRIRPALAYAVGGLKENVAGWAAIRRAAVAVELIHCYSLVHDDLPCMDNDSLRRGQPTCHVKFGEDTALLAGDILQSMAYEVITSRLFDESVQSIDSTIILKQVQILATASSKMVGGQTLDLQSEGIAIDQNTLEAIHHNKTGALILAAITMSAVTTFDTASNEMQKLKEFGRAIGLAFQVQDDILDIIAETEVLGKTAGKDLQVEKSTYPALMGLEQAQHYASRLHQEALDALAYFGNDADELHQITQFLLKRKS